MSPWARLAAAAMLAWLFASTLSPRDAAGGGPDVERWIVESRDTFGAGQWAAALAPTRALVEHFPTQQVYSDRLARIYFHLGQPREEAAAWEQFVRSSATPEDACPALGQAYLRAGDRAASLDAFVRCRDFDRSSAEGWLHLGLAYRRERRHDEALETFRQAVTIDPLHADSRVGLAGTLLRVGAPEEALEAIGPAVDYDPGNADVHLMRGLALTRLGRHAEARDALARAATITDSYADVHLAIGILDHAEGRRVEAHDRFARALALAPGRRGEVQPWLDRTEGGRR